MAAQHPWLADMQRLRARTHEPGLANPGHAAKLGGLALLQAMIEGRVPDPPITRTLDFYLLEAERGRSIRVVLAGGGRAAVLLSATTIELLDARDVDRHPFVARLGPDVLDPTTTAAVVRARYASPAFSRRSLAALLLDQRFLAGPGNYLRSEILHAARLHPAARPVDLAVEALDRLARATIALPRQSLATGGVTNDRVLERRLATLGVAFEERRFRAYGRDGERCHACGGRIRRIDAGRAIFFCPRCQHR